MCGSIEQESFCQAPSDVWMKWLMINQQDIVEELPNAIIGKSWYFVLIPKTKNDNIF